MKTRAPAAARLALLLAAAFLPAAVGDGGGGKPPRHEAKGGDGGGRERAPGREAGLAAHYFRDPIEWDGHWREGTKPAVDPVAWTFREYRYTRVEPLVNHLFIRRGWFSVRWVGWIRLAPPGEPEPIEPVEVDFEVWADDGARLLIGGEKLIDDWRPQAETEAGSHRSVKARLRGGPHRIVLEYFQGESLRRNDPDPVKLYWSCEARKIPRQIVPAAHFTHDESDLRDPLPSTVPAEERAGVRIVMRDPPEPPRGGKKGKQKSPAPAAAEP